MSTKTKRPKNNKAKEEFIEKQKDKPILGEIVSWSQRGATHSYGEVLESLKKANLDTSIAKVILPSQAFQRAISKLEENGDIDVLHKQGDIKTFQLTDKFLQEKGNSKEWKWNKKTELTLHTGTGKITCPIPEVEKFAQAELDRAVDTRTSGDITSIIKEIFRTANPDLGIIDITDNGGCYLVLAEHSHFCDNIQDFLTNLGRNLQRFPIAKGSKDGEASIANAVSDQMEKLTLELNKEVTEFTVSTRNDTLEKACERIKDLRIKIESCAHYLKEKRDDALAVVEQTNLILLEKISKLSEDRKNAPPRTTLATGVGIVAFIEQKLREATLKAPVTQEAILSELVVSYPDRPEKGMKHTIYVQLCSKEYSSLMKKGLVIRKNEKGFYLEK